MTREPLKIPVPWGAVFGLGPKIARGERTSVDAFSASVVKGIEPKPVVEGLENLPASSRFVLAANHYERKGLWILHSAAALTQAIRQRYGPGDPPVRWIVTANWPPWKVGRWQFASPGDRLLPKVAHTLACYPVSFAGTNPAYTARTLRELLRDARTTERPIGIFPEGAAGRADEMKAALPGIERLLVHLARAGMPVTPVGISEKDSGLILRFGRVIGAEEVAGAEDAGALVMERIRMLAETAVN